MKTVQVIDSHTEGEPTRVVVVGGPELGEGSISEKCDRFITEFDHFRSAVINEPRGSEYWWVHCSWNRNPKSVYVV